MALEHEFAVRARDAGLALEPALRMPWLAQRAYNDALRDLLAPVFTGQPVLRVPVPDRNVGAAVDRLARGRQVS